MLLSYTYLNAQIQVITLELNIVGQDLIFLNLVAESNLISIHYIPTITNDYFIYKVRIIAFEKNKDFIHDNISKGDFLLFIGRPTKDKVLFDLIVAYKNIIDNYKDIKLVVGDGN